MVKHEYILCNGVSRNILKVNKDAVDFIANCTSKEYNDGTKVILNRLLRDDIDYIFYLFRFSNFKSFQNVSFEFVTKFRNYVSGFFVISNISFD